jgi:hypothetical protein
VVGSSLSRLTTVLRRSSLHDLIAAFGDGDWIKQYRDTRYSQVSLSPRSQLLVAPTGGRSSPVID